MQVALITFGISVFMGFQQSSGSKHESVQRLEGVALLLLSLALDGFTGPLQVPNAPCSCSNSFLTEERGLPPRNASLHAIARRCMR